MPSAPSLSGCPLPRPGAEWDPEPEGVSHDVTLEEVRVHHTALPRPGTVPSSSLPERSGGQQWVLAPQPVGSALGLVTVGWTVAVTVPVPHSRGRLSGRDIPGMLLGAVFHCTGRGTGSGRADGSRAHEPRPGWSRCPVLFGAHDTTLSTDSQTYAEPHASPCGVGMADGPYPAICSGPGTGLGVCAIAPVAERETRLWL